MSQGQFLGKVWTTEELLDLGAVSLAAQINWSCSMTDSQDRDIREANARADRQTEGPGGGVVAPMHPDPHTITDPAVETPVEGRQGFLGRPVLAVLVGGLILAGLAWIVVHYMAG